MYMYRKHNDIMHMYTVHACMPALLAVGPKLTIVKNIGGFLIWRFGKGMAIHTCIHVYASIKYWRILT